MGKTSKKQRKKTKAILKGVVNASICLNEMCNERIRKTGNPYAALEYFCIQEEQKKRIITTACKQLVSLN